MSKPGGEFRVVSRIGKEDMIGGGEVVIGKVGRELVQRR
jgi:hypothetical protein